MTQKLKHGEPKLWMNDDDQSCPFSFLILSLFPPSNMPCLDDYQDIARQYASYVNTYLNTSIHIAFVYGRGGMLIGMSTNRVGSRSRGAGFSKWTIHAERAALKAVGDNSMLRGAILVVIRVGKHGILPSKPCHECTCHLEKAMNKYGLKKVYYS